MRGFFMPGTGERYHDGIWQRVHIQWMDEV